MAVTQYDFGNPDWAGGRRGFWGWSGRAYGAGGGGGESYTGLPFWDPMYRSNPGQWSILDALGRHDRRIADRNRELFELSRRGQPIDSMNFEPGEWKAELSPAEKAYLGDPSQPDFGDRLKTYMKEQWLGPDQKFSLKDIPRILWNTIRIVGNPAGYALGTAAKIGTKELGNLFRNTDWGDVFEGDPQAARDAFDQALADPGLGDLLSGMQDVGRDPMGRAMDPSAGEPDQGPNPRPGGGSYNYRGMNNGGLGGLLGGMQGGYMGNPNIAAPMSWSMPVAGQNASIPVIQGPSWVGPQFDPNGYEPIMF